MNQLPIYIHSEKVSVLVVGGGGIALRKLKIFLSAGVNPTIIATTVTDECRKLIEKNNLVYYDRAYEAGDAISFHIVVAATNSATVNEQIQMDARQFICRVDDADKGNIILPATIRRGQLVLAVSTGGASPGLTKKIAKQLNEQFDENYAEYIDFLASVRKQYKGNHSLLQAIINERFLKMTKPERLEELKKLLQLSN